MKELMSILPYVLLALSMAAALTVVFVATLKILLRSFHRPTAVILALGVTILAVAGTTQIIFVEPQPSESILAPIPSANSLILLPFITLAIASLLAQLLAAAGATAPQPDSGLTDKGPADAEPGAQPDAKAPDNEPAQTKPRGRPRKPSAGPSPQEPPVELKKKMSSPKTSQSVGTDPAGMQKTEEPAGTADKP